MKVSNIVGGILAAAGCAVALPTAVNEYNQTFPSYPTQKPLKNLIYLDQWHHDNLQIPADLSVGITHVVIGFAGSTLFNGTTPGAYEPFMPIADVRAMFPPSTLVGIAIGGWGDTAGLSEGCRTPESRTLYATNVAAMADQHGFDFVDIDWEFPGGNGQDYKEVPNSAKVNEIADYPALLVAIKAAITPRPLSIATPAKADDMIAFTPDTAASIFATVDWINIMTYDLINRRDSVTAHHTDVAGSLAAVDRYLALGANPAQLNLGFAYYAKFFTTAEGVDCTGGAIGCPLETAEAPDGSDTYTSGAITFEPASYAGDWGASLASAMQYGVTDEAAGGQTWWDAENRWFWTFETPALVARKFDQIVAERKLGGVFAWSLGEDTADWHLFRAVHEGVTRLNA